MAQDLGDHSKARVARLTALLADLDFGHEQREELLVLIDEECNRINNLIASASEMARLDAGQIKLHLAPHSVRELISASLADCQGVLPERRIDLEVKDRESLVLVDLSFPKKVLVHLVDNANLYSSPGQPITVRAAPMAALRLALLTVDLELKKQTLDASSRNSIAARGSAIVSTGRAWDCPLRQRLSGHTGAPSKS